MQNLDGRHLLGSATPQAHPKLRRRLHDLRDRTVLKALLIRTRYRRRMATNARQQHVMTQSARPEHPEGWRQELCQSHVVSRYGHMLTRIAGSDDAWAAGSLLPNVGSTCWHVRIACKQREGGLLCIGVCDADSTCGWGLHLGSGRLLRFTRDGATGLVETIDVGPPPPGLPDMRGRKIILDPETGNATRMQGALQGAILTCRFDAECGTFSISVNGSASRVALDSLPKRVALRPWARLAHVADQVEVEFERLDAGSWLKSGARLGQRLLGRAQAPQLPLLLPRVQRV